MNEANRSLGTCDEGQPKRPDFPLSRWLRRLTSVRTVSPPGRPGDRACDTGRYPRATSGHPFRPSGCEAQMSVREEDGKYHESPGGSVGSSLTLRTAHRSSRHSSMLKHPLAYG